MDKDIIAQEINAEYLKGHIYNIRGVRVMLDMDLAKIYGYSTKDFNRQVKNNIEKFEQDFMFQLSDEERGILRCKIPPQVGEVVDTILMPLRNKEYICL